MKRYLLDHLVSLIIVILMMTLSYFMADAFQTSRQFIYGMLVVEGIGCLSLFLYDFLRKHFFYQDLHNKLTHLDQKYLLNEMLERPRFYEGQVLYDTLYQANKSMNEHLAEYERELTDYKDFIEMWIHQVKTPIASLSLLLHHEHNQKALTQLNRIENYTSQVLYYIRSQSKTKDYLIKEVNLSDVVNHVLVRNKDDLLAYGFDFQIDPLDVNVYSDAKWLEFILDQIVSNAIKYRKEHPVLKIYTKEDQDHLSLMIEDHGLGIKASDLPQVFKNSYTGYNGHIESKATGMGLFIVKKLCDALGHQVSIDSREGSYTIVTITFGKHDYFIN